MATQYTDVFDLPYPDGNSGANPPIDIKALADRIEAILDAPWTPYTPGLVNWSAGSGATIVAAYRKIGRTVLVRGRIILGASPAFSGTPAVKLPFAPRADAYDGSSAQMSPLGTALYRDASNPTIRVSGSCTLLAGNGAVTDEMFFTVSQIGSYTGVTTVTGTFPFTWAVGDVIAWEATYEAAA